MLLVNFVEQDPLRMAKNVDTFGSIWTTSRAMAMKTIQDITYHNNYVDDPTF